MKRRNFLRIIIFILIFLGINHVLGDLFVGWSRFGSEYGISHREFQKRQEQVTFIALGDSHPQKAVMVSKIEDAYNLSSSAESYIHTYYIMKYYLEEGDFHPQVALVEIDPHGFLSAKLEGLFRRDPAYWEDYVPYLKVENETLGDKVATYLKGEFPLFGGFQVFLTEYWPRVDLAPEPSVLGFVAKDGDISEYSEGERQRDGAARAGSHFENQDYMDAAVVEYFQRLIDLLNEYEVSVVLVWYPTSNYYYESVGEYISVETHLGRVEDLVEESQVDAVLDYHDLFFDHPEYFTDPDHLNIIGASTMTDRLVEDLTSAGLLPVTPSN